MSLCKTADVNMVNGMATNGKGLDVHERSDFVGRCRAVVSRRVAIFVGYSGIVVTVNRSNKIATAK